MTVVAWRPSNFFGRPLCTRFYTFFTFIKDVLRHKVGVHTFSCFSILLLWCCSVGPMILFYMNFGLKSKTMNYKLFENHKSRRGLLSVLLLLCGTLLLTAQNGIAISDFAMKAGTITFNVSWNKNNMPKEWSDTVWVLVDYNDKGAMKRLPLATSATLTATSAPGVGKVEPAPNNNKGVWLIGNARTADAFSATVQLLTATANLSGMCVYAINYPPVGRYTSNTTIAFKGTPKYVVTLDNNQTVTATSPYTIPAGRSISSFTDASGAPGVIKCTPTAVRTLAASGSSFCEGAESIQFALSGTDKGVSYLLLKDGVTPLATLTGNGSAATFSQRIATEGTYTARVEAGNYCPVGMSGTHTIIKNPLPANPAVTAGSRCGAGTVNVRATSGGAMIDWYGAATGGAVLANGTAKTIFTTPSITTSATYYAQARNSNTGCLSAARTPVLATINPLPANPAVTAGSRCSVGAVTLSAASSGAVIDWYSVATDGTVLANGTATGTFTTLSISTSATYYAQARNSNTGCLSAARTAVLATINPLPANPAVTAGSRCGAGTVNVSATSSGAVIDWYSAATGGTVLANGTAKATFTTPSITTSATYYAQARYSNTGCLSAARTTVLATINPLPANPAATASSRCGAGTVNVRSASSGAVIDWYGAATGGTVLANGTATGTFTTPSITTSTTYYAQARNNNTACLSAARTPVLATINTLPGVPAVGGGGTQCGGTRKITATAGTDGTGVRWKDNSSTVSPREVSSSGTYEAVSTTAAKCESDPSAVTVTIASSPTITRKGGDATQTVNENKAITSISYTVVLADQFELYPGTKFPDGVTGTFKSSTLTISGTPTKVGSFSYTVYAANKYCSAKLPGTIHVMPVAPTTAASTSTWPLGDQIWSDRVVGAPSACTQVTQFSYATNKAECKIFEGRYYYSWTCVMNHKDVLCPSPWRVPELAAVQKVLDKYGHATLVKYWGTGGFFSPSQSTLVQPDGGFYWTTNAYQYGNADAFRMYFSQDDHDHNRVNRANGIQVRCVR
jgi:hypothetical protein